MGREGLLLPMLSGLAGGPHEMFALPVPAPSPPQHHTPHPTCTGSGAVLPPAALPHLTETTDRNWAPAPACEESLASFPGEGGVLTQGLLKCLKSAASSNLEAGSQVGPHRASLSAVSCTDVRDPLVVLVLATAKNTRPPQMPACSSPPP